MSQTAGHIHWAATTWPQGCKPFPPAEATAHFLPATPTNPTCQRLVTLRSLGSPKRAPLVWLSPLKGPRLDRFLEGPGVTALGPWSTWLQLESTVNGSHMKPSRVLWMVCLFLSLCGNINSYHLLSIHYMLNSLNELSF